MTEIELMPDPKPTEIVPEQALYVAVYWWQPSDTPNPLPMYSFGYNKQDAIKYAVENSSRNPDKPIKLFRLNYGDDA